jgi:protoporphyrin/coproporphyrin ferrochelatase
MKKTAILIINLGTPASPSKGKVRRFLSEFLNDPRVIDLPYIARKMLVNLIIVPFRAGKSTRMYQKIWSDKGSPIMFHSMELLEKLNVNKKDHEQYFLAMRYGQPSIKSVLAKIYEQGFDKITLVPLYPQYASSTTGSVIEECLRVISEWAKFPDINVLGSFYREHAYISLWANRLKSINYTNYEHILFVFHGLPVKQVEQTHPGKTCDELKCRDQVITTNKFCYNAQCHENTRLLASELDLPPNKYSLCYQSRFGKKWLMPFADKVIEELAARGVKNLLIVPLSFVADCLETRLEIEIEYRDLFIEKGGQKLVMPESLNAGDDWVKALIEIIHKTS